MSALAHWWETLPWQSAALFGFGFILGLCIVGLWISRQRDPVRREMRALRNYQKWARRNAHVAHRPGIPRGVEPAISRAYLLAMQAERRVRSQQQTNRGITA